jgi:hypothetical protein
MAGLKQITVIIDKQGGSTIEASGFTGDSCLKATRSLEEALGKVSDREMKPEANRDVEIADKATLGR